MSTLLSQSYVFDPRPAQPYLLTLKRYWQPSPPALTDANAITVILAHGNGFSKEHWEPTIDDLYYLPAVKSGKVKIRELWSIDAQNHGEAVYLNEQELQYRQQTFRWEDYARGIHAVLTGQGTGVDVDFSTRRLVAIGHSIGSAAVAFSTIFFPPINYEALVLVEPVILSPELFYDPPNHLEAQAARRRDIWPSKEDALAYTMCKPMFQGWDKRIFDIYVEHCLRPLPTIDYPDRKDGVTLACTKMSEAALFRDPLGPTRMHSLLSHVLKGRPVHIIYGTIDDSIQRQGAKADALNKASGGIENFASVSWIDGVGHLMVQTHPLLVAQALCEILSPLSRGAIAAIRAML